MALLEIKEVVKHFGGLVALERVTFDVSESEIVGLVGPNGAGKSTMLNVVSGFFPPTTGQVFFDGRDITALRADHVAQTGIGRTFQQTNLFMQATVLENVFMGFYKQHKEPVWKALLHTSSVKREDSALREKAVRLLELTGLSSLQNELVLNLPHGHQRILSICVALGSKPKLLLLDEPLTGMNPTEKLAMVNFIRKIRDMGVTIALVEHDMKAVMSLCERIVVLNFGRKIAEGDPDTIKRNAEVIEAYLGREEEEG